jgi:imidazole glycerol phosphate synthase glutamine amidotransferase subunit
VVSAAPARIVEASHVMLPGVGAFAASMARLIAVGADVALVERLAADRPTIAICVGHQLLFETSDESPGGRGLGFVEGHVGRFPEMVRAPQFGWNEVEAGEAAVLLESGHAYFANSYRAVEAPGWRVAWADHGGRFVAAMERGNLLGCQFHPELSGAYGAALLSRFMELG